MNKTNARNIAFQWASGSLNEADIDNVFASLSSKDRERLANAFRDLRVELENRGNLPTQPLHLFSVDAASASVKNLITLDGRDVIVAPDLVGGDLDEAMSAVGWLESHGYIMNTERSET